MYLLECSDGSFYCGATNDISKRVREHNTGKRGAKYTRSRRPLQLRWTSPLMDKISALKLEYKLQHKSHSYKAFVIANHLKEIK